MKKATRESSLNNQRITFIFFLIILCFLAVYIRLFVIQVIDHKKYQAYALDQYWSDNSIPAKRGDILSSDGFILAGTQTHYILFAKPYLISNINQVVDELSDVMYEIKKKHLEEIKQSISSNNNDSEVNPIEKDEEEAKLKDDLKVRYSNLISPDMIWVLLERGLTPEDKNLIESKNIDGIGFEDDPLRYYPEGSLAAHVLGFVASNEKGEKTGYYGVEAAFNHELKGKEGRVMEEKDAVGNPIFKGDSRKSNPIPGRDITLSLVKSLQYITEQKLKNGVESFDAKSGSVIVMDPMTGKILVMANYPTYLPYYFGAEDESNNDEESRKTIERTNLSISQTYEPGSVIKPFTVATGIDLNIITSQTTFEDNGPVSYSGYVIDNWDGKHHGVLDISGLLEKSNNIGAAWVGHKVGAKNLHDYFENFGYGKISQISLQGEQSANLRSYDTWTDIDLANISFGQGISTTPLQVINAFNVFANNGYLLEPKIVESIKDGSESIDIPTKVVRKVISTQTSNTMVRLLENSAEGGEAKYFILKDYKIAGKTGTAEIFRDGKYDSDKTNATFVGFLSGDNRVSMIVKLEEPKKSVFASETAVPLWMDIMTEIIRFYGITPDRQT